MIKDELRGSENVPGVIDSILKDYPGISWSLEGEAREQADIFESLKLMSLIALFIIYALLAIPLRSYIQPVIVMIVIPFGLIGAILGHVLMGEPTSIISVRITSYNVCYTKLLRNNLLIK